MTTVTITTELQDDDGEYWAMKFIFTTENLEYTFHIEQPFEKLKSEWLGLAEGKNGVDLFDGNGEGTIYPRYGDKLEFTAEPQGHRAEVSSIITIPRALVADKLKATIEEADKLGYKFAEE